MTDIGKELTANKTILLLMTGAKYNSTMVKVAKDLAREKVCYVTLNKTYDSLNETFKKAKINTKNMIFIDAISKTFKDTPDKKGNCMYCSSPGAVMELSISISKVLNKHKCKYLIFDSLTNLLIYQKKAPVAAFVSKIVNTVKDKNTNAVFYALKMGQHEELIQEASMFVDKVVNAK